MIIIIVAVLVVRFTVGCVSSGVNIRQTESSEYWTQFGNGKLRTDWLFIYYMPYDNNLSDKGETIIKMIGDNIKSENVIASVQAEFANVSGMKRYLITNQGISITAIENDRSASINTYQEYLEWVKDNVEYNKLAVIFLDHGGKLDEICLDERPIYQFLKIDEVNSVLIDVFGKESIDLLFLQVCTKGVIEALYEFKDTSKYILGSQTVLGAPNYYYQGLFSAFSNQTISTGYDVAELIVNNERYDMYNSYTLIDNAKMRNLYNLFSVFINQIQNNNTVLTSIPLYINYYDESYLDIISILENIPETEYRNRLMEYIKNELITIYKINPCLSGTMNEFSGLSISGVTDDKYDRLEFYKLLGPIRELNK